MNQLAAQPSFEFVISVLNGKDKGAVYKMLSTRISIGRADDNDICITTDPKISRYHASLTVSPEGVEVRDISDKNKVLVNGEAQSIAKILPGSIIQLGDTKLKFDIGNSLATVQSANPAANHLHIASVNGVAAPTSRSSGRSRRSDADSGRLRFYIIVAAVLGGFFYIMNSPSSKKFEPAEIRTQEESMNQIQKNRESVRLAQEQEKKLGYDTEEYRQAESLYIKGFRDYQKGQYARAKDSFQACLAIFPQHPECNNYFKEAQKKASELIQYYLNLGYEYQSKNQFQYCISAFNNVMYLERDKTSTIFREADAGRDACQAALR